MTEIPLPALDELRGLAAKASEATGVDIMVDAAYRLIDGEVRQVEGYSVAFIHGWYAPLDRYAASAVIDAFRTSHAMAAA